MHGASHVIQAEQGYHLGTHLSRLPSGRVIRDVGHRREHRFALNAFGFGTGNLILLSCTHDNFRHAAITSKPRNSIIASYAIFGSRLSTSVVSPLICLPLRKVAPAIRSTDLPRFTVMRIIFPLVKVFVSIESSDPLDLYGLPRPCLRRSEPIAPSHGSTPLRGITGANVTLSDAP